MYELQRSASGPYQSHSCHKLDLDTESLEGKLLPKCLCYTLA